MSNDLANRFPNNLDEKNHRITSDETPRYNCVAWAANDSSRWWSHLPGYYWPAGVARDGSVTAYVEVFRRLGFELCDDSEPEPGFEKVALFGKAGEFKHVARLLESGKWTSKLGTLEDIEHDDLYSLAHDSDDGYGHPLVFRIRLAGDSSTNTGKNSKNGLGTLEVPNGNGAVNCIGSIGASPLRVTIPAWVGRS